MRTLYAVAMVGLFASLSACSGIKTNYDYDPGIDFSPYRTYAWMQIPTESRDPRITSLADSRLKTAADAALQAKGYRKVESGEPDFWVGYYLALDDRVDYQTVNTYWGPGWGYGRYGGYYGGMGTSQTTRRDYTVGTLVFDFFDNDTRELIWRGTAEGELRQSRDVEERAERTNEVVNKVLANFPPS